MKYSRVALCWLLACLSGEALAWSNHSLGAAIALRDAKGVQGVEPVKVESLRRRVWSSCSTSRKPLLGPILPVIRHARMSCAGWLRARAIAGRISCRR